MDLKSLEIKFSFYCRTSYSNKKGLCPIVLRIFFRGCRKDVFTDLYCNPLNWDVFAQRLSEKSNVANTINQNLDEILHKCKELFDKLRYRGRAFTLDQFVMHIKGNEALPETIIGYLNRKTAELKERVGVDITPATLQKYHRCIKHMKEFLFAKYKKNDIAIGSVSSDMIMDFFYFLRTEKSNSHNTSVYYIKCLKTVMLPAIKKGYIDIDPFLGLKIAPKQVMRGFLTLDEIRTIAALNDLNDGIKQVRDIFLFACYTGMAYIDIKQFTRGNLIKETDGTICIHKPRQKTGQLSIIPLLPPAKRILQEYSLTGDIADFAWTVITNQKVNEHLKTIGKKAGITQGLFFHLARHTFATTITLTNGVPIETVSRMLGHTNIKMTQRYAKISGYKIKEDMKRIMGLF